MQLLGGIPAQTFLQRYWQKKPLLIRQAIPDFVSPLSPDEVAGLACDANVESRLILEKDGITPWQLEYGPFAEDRFRQLPPSHWTLLVQRVNQLVPQLAEMLDQFTFIPGWRIDDVMVSFAPPQGSVGPHVDQYDVFLLQGLGTRRWQITTQDTRQHARQDNTQLDLLLEFEAEEEWELMPGDMLYLPPNVAHYGVALNSCLTFSIGFRAPRYTELISAWTDDQMVQLSDKLHYQDPELQLQQHSGEIDAAARERIRNIVRQQFVSNEQIDRWFGCFITESPPQAMSLEPETLLQTDTFRDQLTTQGELWRSEFCRFAFIRGKTTIWLYVDGQEIELTLAYCDLIALLCDQRCYSLANLKPYLQDSQMIELLTRLYNMGAVEFTDVS
jgi:50S ribosomal protein L16 3-hydroxylase